MKEDRLSRDTRYAEDNAIFNFSMMSGKVIQIHDELDLSVESESHAKKVIEIMENAVSLEVPNKVDYEKGKTWGDIYDKE